MKVESWGKALAYTRLAPVVSRRRLSLAAVKPCGPSLGTTSPEINPHTRKRLSFKIYSIKSLVLLVDRVSETHFTLRTILCLLLANSLTAGPCSTSARQFCSLKRYSPLLSSLHHSNLASFLSLESIEAWVIFDCFPIISFAVLVF